MLKQWRFKIVKKFALCRGEIQGSEQVEKYLHTKPRPDRVFVYKPTGKKYDYIDYTGCGKDEEVDISEPTVTLEVLGYLKFVGEESLG